MIDYSDLIGVPFVNFGRDVNIGLDCYGLVIEVYKRYGKQLAEYHADCHDQKMINEIIKRESYTSKWRKLDITKKEPLIPCVLALRFNSPPGIVNHTGVYIGNGKFIHTREKIGVCVDSIYSPAWVRHIAGFYEFLE